MSFDVEILEGQRVQFEQFHEAIEFIHQSIGQWNAFAASAGPIDIHIHKTTDENDLEVWVSDEIGISESLG